MKSWLVLFGLLITVSSWAQITITRAQFPDSVGYTTPYLNFTDATVALGTTTGAQRWDFSQIPASAWRSTYTDISPNMTEYLTTFNWGTTSAPKYASIAQPGMMFGGGLVDTSGTHSYFRYGTDAFELLGFSLMNNATIPDQAVKMTNQVRMEWFPMSVNRTWTDSIKAQIQLPDSAGMTLYAKILMRMQNTIDSYGTLVYPGDSVQALRQVTVTSGQIQVGTYLGPIFIVATRMGIPTQTTVTYLAQNVGMLVSVTSDTAVSTPNFTHAANVQVSARHYINSVSEPSIRLALPTSPELAAYPNPFNPSTSIEFQSPTSGVGQLAVYDALGREVAVLFSGSVQGGRRYNLQWQGAHTAGSYFARWTIDGNSKTVKLERLP